MTGLAAAAPWSWRRLVAIAALAGCVALACSSGGGTTAPVGPTPRQPAAAEPTPGPTDPPPTARPTPVPTALRVVTFDAALADGVALANERAAPVVEAMATLDADIVLVQGLLLPGVADTLRDAAAGAFPLVVVPEPETLGLALLSRHVVLDTDVLDLGDGRRALLHVLVDAGTHGPIHLFGADLAPVGSEPLLGPAQAARVAALRDFVADEADPGDAVIVLGDLNAGPAGSGFEAHHPTSYELLVAAGFTNPYIESGDALCSTCAHNPLNEADRSLLTHHILVRDVDGAVTARRILDEPDPVLSPHYGLVVTIGP